MKRFLSSLLLMGLGLSAPSLARAQDLPRLSIGDATVLEGNSRFREITFPVTISRVVTTDVSARYRTADLTALAPGDYTAQPAGQVVIKAGQKSAKIVLRVTTDTVEEADEQFAVRLFEPKRAAFADAEAIATIKDDDYAGTISIGDTSIVEGDSGSTIAAVPLNFSQAPLHPIELRFQTVDDSAKVSLGDYSTTRGSLQVQPGAVGLAIAVPVVGDTAVETDEKFFVRITAPGYRVAKSLGIGLIRNDDVPPPTPTPTPLPPSVALSVADISVVEGNGETTNTQTGDTHTPAQFTVTLAQAATRDITLTYTTQDGSAPVTPAAGATPAPTPAPATAPGDYTATTGTVVFKVGDTTATFIVPVVGDKIEETDEAFTVKISASGGVTGDAEAVATIKDDDYAGTISIGDTSVVEGNTGTTSAKLPITLSPAPLHPLEVVFGTLDGTATAEQDYTATSGKLLFPAGTGTAPSTLAVEVKITTDTIGELDETLSVEISSNGATFTKFSGLITITNDDGPPPVPKLGKIAFVSTRNGNNEIYIMNGDGTNQTRLTNNAASDTFPRLSGDGQKIVFQSDRDGNAEIYIMNADGTGQTRLTNNPSTDEFPSISADATRIAFSRSGTPSEQIYVMNADGSGQTQLTSTTDDRYPAISPDGSKIAYTNFGAAVDQLVVMNADGTNRVVIVGQANEVYVVLPTFSPDGKQIAVSIFDLNGNANDYQIYSVNVDGSNFTPLTFNSAANFYAAYSPEGDKLAFSSSRPSADGIFVIKNDGSGEMRLVDGDYPSWSVGSVGSKGAASVPGSGSAGSS